MILATDAPVSSPQHIATYTSNVNNIHAISDNHEAFILFRDGHKSRAIRLFMQSSHEGSGYSAYDLALMLHSVKWLKKAATDGLAAAQYQLSYYYYTKGEFTRFMYWNSKFDSAYPEQNVSLDLSNHILIQPSISKVTQNVHVKASTPVSDFSFILVVIAAYAGWRFVWRLST